MSLRRRTTTTPDFTRRLWVTVGLLVMVAALSLPIGAVARPLIVVGEEFPPYKFIDNGKPVGFDIDVLKLVLDRLQINYEIHLLPWARAWHMLETGEADIGLAVSYNAERAESVYYCATPVWQADFVFFTNSRTKRLYPFTNLQEVARAPKNVKIGVIRENSYAPIFWETFSSPNPQEGRYDPRLDPAPDAQVNMKKLEADRIQLYPVPITIGRYLIKKMNLHDVSYYDWVIFSKPYPTVFSKKSNFSAQRFNNIAAVMQAYDKELRQLKADNKAFNAMFEKY